MIDRTEAPPYYFNYIDLVPAGDICALLESQHREVDALLRGISDERSRFRYAPDKWSIREVVGHVNDAERLFTFRAFWFARGFESELPGFDQTIAALHAASDVRPWLSHVKEFHAVRSSTLDLFRHLPPEAWQRSGRASGYGFTVRALAHIIAGHTIHHVTILKERYGSLG